MGLLSSASFVVTPNGYKANKLYAVIPSDGSGDMTFSRVGNTATRENSSSSVESVLANVPRIDYLGSSCPKLLLEPQRTNLIQRSAEFENAFYGLSNCSVTANFATSPAGTMTADRLVLTGTTSVLRDIRTSTITTASGVSVTLSTFIKYVDKQFVQLMFSGGYSSGFANFDLINGTVTAGTYTRASIENYGNGWYRISVTTTSLSTSAIAYIHAIDTGNALRFANSTSNGTQSYLIWGAQLEQGGTLSSYIPTTTASVTRNVDACLKDSISQVIGQNEGTMYCQIDLSVRGDNSYIALRNSSNTNFIRFNILSSSIQCELINASVQTALINLNNSSTGSFKLAIAYKANDIAFYMNGVLIGTSASPTIPASSIIDLYYNSILPIGIKSFALWGTRLANSDLAILTT